MDTSFRGWGEPEETRERAPAERMVRAGVVFLREKFGPLQGVVNGGGKAALRVPLAVRQSPC